jgi:putative membrane protein
MFTTSTMGVQANFRENRLLQTILAVYTVLWVALAFGPFDRFDWMLENILTVLFVGLLFVTYRIFPLSDLSYVLIFVFMVLHAIGGHYTYSEVPFGYWLKDALHLSRNHFDRIVHFSFGLLIAYPIRELFLRVASARGFWAYYLPLDVTLAFSAVYEIIEMAAAQVTNPELGMAYLGTQGDVWDAQKDMCSAAIGAVLSMVITATMRRLLHKRQRLPVKELTTSV